MKLPSGKEDFFQFRIHTKDKIKLKQIAEQKKTTVTNLIMNYISRLLEDSKTL